MNDEIRIFAGIECIQLTHSRSNWKPWREPFVAAVNVKRSEKDDDV